MSGIWMLPVFGCPILGSLLYSTKLFVKSLFSPLENYCVIIKISRLTSSKKKNVDILFEYLAIGKLKQIGLMPLQQNSNLFTIRVIHKLRNTTLDHF